MNTVPVITGTIPVTDYYIVGLLHGHAESLDPAPLSHVAAAAISGLAAHAAELGADLVIDVSTSIAPHGLEGSRVLATGTAIKFRDDTSRLTYRHLTEAPPPDA